MISVDELQYYEDLLDLLDTPFGESSVNPLLTSTHHSYIVDELDLETDQDLASDSSSTTEDNFDLLSSEKISRKRKCKSHSSDCDSPPRIKKAKSPYSVVAPSKYANFLISALNQHDSQALRECFHTICTEEARISFNIYNLRNQGCIRPFNHFGNFSSANLDQEGFIAFQAALSEIVPDGFMEVLNSRSCYEGDDSSVYISCFRSSGTIINQDSMIGIADENGQLRQIRQSNLHLCNISATQKFMKPFISEGSLIMYRNAEGKVTNIELYYEYSL